MILYPEPTSVTCAAITGSRGRRRVSSPPAAYLQSKVYSDGHLFEMPPNWSDAEESILIAPITAPNKPSPRTTT
jgi:hypothetical protein